MKTTMKLFTYGLIILSLTFTSCSKDGDIGPIGPVVAKGTSSSDGTHGVDGTDGIDRADGTDGNVDVQVIEYDTENITTDKGTYSLGSVSLNKLNESLVLGFYTEIMQTPNAENSFVTKKRWVSVPGRGTTTLFETKVIIEGSTAVLSGGSSTDFIINLYELGTSFAFLRK